MLKLTTTFIALVTFFALVHAAGQGGIAVNHHDFSVKKLGDSHHYSVDVNGKHYNVDTTETSCVNSKTGSKVDCHSTIAVDPNGNPLGQGGPQPYGPVQGSCFQCRFFSQVELVAQYSTTLGDEHTANLECLFLLFNTYSPTRDWAVTMLNPSQSGQAVIDTGMVDLRTASYIPNGMSGGGWGRQAFRCSNGAIAQISCPLCRTSGPYYPGSAVDGGTGPGMGPGIGGPPNFKAKAKDGNVKLQRGEPVADAQQVDTNPKSKGGHNQKNSEYEWHGEGDDQA